MKRVVSAFIFTFFLMFCFLTPVHADNYIDNGYGEAIKAAINNGDINSQAHVSSVNTSNYSDFVRRVLGAVEGITIDTKDMNTPYAEEMQKQSAIYALGNYIDAIYTHPPASTYAFVQDLGQTLGFMPKQAYAQGIGFTALSPLLPIWKVFRNISYALLAIVMVVIGFLVMFRKKIDPKTVVTVQSALPKIVVSLILITFSYAIVGLMIDLMYVVMYLIISLIVNAAPDVFTSKSVINTYINGGFGQLGLFRNQNAWSISTDLAAFITSAEFWQNLSGALIASVVGLALLFVYIRILVMLISAYIQIIISLILAPTQFLFDAIPGAQGGFSAWIKNLISNLVVFPITAILLLVGRVLSQSSTLSGKLWVPPFLGNGTDSQGIAGLISLGILLTIPSVVKGIQESMKAKPLVNAGLGSIGGAFAQPTQTAMQLYQFYTSRETMKAFKNLGKGEKG